jgi:hypothetical protein
MKTRMLVSITVFVLVAAVFLIFPSCGNDNGDMTPTWIGTWINPDYDGTVEGGGKIKISYLVGDDYRWAEYDNSYDPSPGIWIVATVTNQWTDSEGNLFIEAIVDTESPNPDYRLCKIHADNQTMEMNVSEVDYPTEIDPAGDEYYIYYRQE